MRRREDDRSGPISYWLRGEVPSADPPLVGDTVADVVVVGAGSTGLWTALALTMPSTATSRRRAR